MQSFSVTNLRIKSLTTVHNQDVTFFNTKAKYYTYKLEKRNPCKIHRDERPRTARVKSLSSDNLVFSNGASISEDVVDPSASDKVQEDDDYRVQQIESFIERKIFNCRFLALMAVAGSLSGSCLCFAKGCLYVAKAFNEYFKACWVGSGSGKVIFLLVEALDIYLMGTVMLIFGMGLYELFVGHFDAPKKSQSGKKPSIIQGSNLFGLFRLSEKPRWLEIRSLDELKTKLGHVIVMILLVGMFEKSKKVPVNTPLDLLFFSLSILMSSGCLFLLSKLNNGHHP